MGRFSVLPTWRRGKLFRTLLPPSVDDPLLPYRCQARAGKRMSEWRSFWKVLRSDLAELPTLRPLDTHSRPMHFRERQRTRAGGRAKRQRRREHSGRGGGGSRSPLCAGRSPPFIPSTTTSSPPRDPPSNLSFGFSLSRSRHALRHLPLCPVLVRNEVRLRCR